MITGGSAGLGAAICRQTVKSGASSLSLDLNRPPQGDFYPLDVTDPDAWRVLAEQRGGPDVLFLNAGMMSAPNRSDAAQYKFLSSTAASYAAVRAVNLDGVVFGLQSLIPRMPAGSCVIVTISLAGIHPYVFDPIYATTKHALVGLVRSVSQEMMARGIRIHGFCPNRIVTDLLPTATQTPQDLTADEAAQAAIGLIDEPSSGYAWGLEAANERLQRHPPIPASIAQRITRRLFKR